MLTIAYNGKEITKKGNKFTDGLFMNLNMPRKNGYATLGEIKRNTYLQSLHVITFSTASGVETIKNVFRNAAHYYMSKPPDFSQMKKVIYEALTLIMQKNNALPLQEKFLITGDSIIIPNKK